MTELREKINNIVEDYNACKVLAKSIGNPSVYEGTTATAEDIKVGKTAYSNGELIEGTYQEGGEIYSMEETRIGTWIDGKPLYRKVVKSVVPSAPNQSTTAEKTVLVTEGIDFAMIKTVIASPVDGHEAYLPTSIGILHISVFMKNDDYFTIYNRGFDYYNGLDVIAVIEYTKKADIATQEV